MKMKDLRDLMKQAEKMQEQLQEQMSQLRIEAASGGGAVQVSMDGSKHLVSLKIDPEAVDRDDVEMLQDLIVAAVNEAARKVDEALASQMGGLSPGLPGVP